MSTEPATRRPSTWPAFLVGLAALAYSVGVVAVASQAPDKGFLSFTGLRVVQVDEGSAAWREGMRPGDVIRSVDGEPVGSILDYVDRVLTREPGETVRVGVEQPAGPEREVTVELRESPLPLGALLATVMSVVLIALGLVARKARPGDVAAIRFFRLSVVYAIVYTGTLSWTHLLIHPSLGGIAIAAVFLSPPIAMDFYMSFPSPAPGSRLPWRLVGWVPTLVLLAIAAVSATMAIEAWQSGGQPDELLRWTVRAVILQLAFSLVVLLIGLAGQFRNMRAARGAERQQLKWLLFGCVLGGVPTLLAIPEAVADIDRFLLVGYQPYVTAMAVLGFATASLAVLRVRLADVDAVISRSVSYALSSALAVGVFLAVALGFGVIAERVFGHTGYASQVVAAVAAAALFGPIHRRVERWLERRFQRDRYHYVLALRELSEAVLRLREPRELTGEVVERTVDALRAKSGALYLRLGDEGERARRFAPVAERGGDWERDIDLDDALEPPRGGVSAPIESSGQVAGALVLGPRLGGDLYSSQDRDLLRALAGQLGIALANARAYGTIAEMTRTLERQNAEIRELRDKLEDENRYLKGRLETALEDRKLVGGSQAVKTLRQQIERAARTEAVVTIVGETGTGKGLAARVIHEVSARAGAPFIQVDCGAIPAGVFESKLFGHERGAFTGAVRNRRGMFELADGGTIFLDEIGELPLDLQPKLLRVLQERSFLRVGGSRPVKVDVRILAATNRDLEAMVRRKELREDLYYRLAVVTLEMPPLRDRRADIPELVRALMPRICRRNHTGERRLAPDALERMQAYGWPGNVRELENVLERAVVLSDGRRIGADDLHLPDAPPPAKELVQRVEVADDADHREVMEAIERERLVEALRASGGNRSGAARALGIPRTTLLNKMRRYGLYDQQGDERREDG